MLQIQDMELVDPACFADEASPNSGLVSRYFVAGWQPLMTWQLKQEVETRFFFVQCLLLQHPGYECSWQGVAVSGSAPNTIEILATKAGLQTTLEVLSSCQRTPQQQLNVLKAALLFALCKSCRCYGQDLQLPDSEQLRLYQKEVLNLAGLGAYPWHRLNTDVLPEILRDNEWQYPRLSHEEDYSSIVVLDAALNRLVADVLAIWLPVRITYVTDKAKATQLLQAFNESPKKQALDARIAQEAEEDKQREAQRKADQDRMDEVLAELLKKSPRMNDWYDLSDEELKKLVWSQPIIELASLFGVSDTAIRKRCDRRGIDRPGQGYWLRKSPEGGPPAPRVLNGPATTRHRSTTA